MEIEFAGWERAGRGRLLQFYATHDEIAEWILEMLPPTFAPYTLLREGCARSAAHRDHGLVFRSRALDALNPIASALARPRC
jgi:phosphoribulokinase